MKPLPRPHFYFGLDLGQRQDHSALCALELRTALTGEFDYVHWRRLTHTSLRLHLALRLPLGHPYLSLVALLRDALGRVGPHPYKTIALDAAGPGAPIAELLRQARLDATLIPITITAAGKPRGRNVSRAALLSNLRICLESGFLRLHPGAADLRSELQAVRLDGKQSPHDDLVLALALAAWPARIAHPAPGKVI
ncbi:MAG: hypothetical protein KJZ84_15655 [Bryobacteraceae bacterium]|nr:hypothetical protein [Bryobacteraceae bacterium]